MNNNVLIILKHLIKWNFFNRVCLLKEIYYINPRYYYNIFLHKK